MKEIMHKVIIRNPEDNYYAPLTFSLNESQIRLLKRLEKENTLNDTWEIVYLDDATELKSLMNKNYKIVIHTCGDSEGYCTSKNLNLLLDENQYKLLKYLDSYATFKDNVEIYTEEDEDFEEI